MTTMIRYGRDLPHESELKLCGTLREGMRALELGISRHQNSIAFALAGAKAIAVDPDQSQIDDLRRRAAAEELHVECHHSDLADLGVVASASIDVVVADHTLDQVDDLPRLFRQVHRVLKNSRPLVIVIPHPFASVHRTDHLGSIVEPYGSSRWTIAEWFTHLSRANFRIDQMHELGVSDISPVPTTLILRAVKEGD